MKWILDNVGKVITAIGFALLVLAVFHDFGYYFMLGRHLQSIQTPYDYLAHSIEWLPLHGSLILGYVLLTLFLTLLFGAGDRAGDGEVRPREYPSGIQDSKRKKALKPIILFFVWGAMVALVSMFFLPTGDYTVGFGVLLFLTVYVAIIFWWWSSRRASRSVYVLLLLFVPLLIIFSFSAGWADASCGLNSSSNVYKIERKDEPTIVANYFAAWRRECWFGTPATAE